MDHSTVNMLLMGENLYSSYLLYWLNAHSFSIPRSGSC